MRTGIGSAFSALGFNLTPQTNAADVLGLIHRLRPQDCGIELVRIGGDRDGGYLIPNDLEGIEYCFSPGVSTVSDFENHLADRNINCFLADYSVDSPPTTRPEFTFDKKFLGSSDRGEFFTIASWKDKYLKDYSGELILQMDIEGGEYEVILNTPDKLLDQFRIVVIEFHALDRLFDPFAFTLFSSCFEKLLERFCVVHLHPNNCCGSVIKRGIEVPRIMEFTFLHRRRSQMRKPQQTFPHKLDADNFPGRSLPLPRCWYSM
jgi:Methyltransferase FkbM domain